MRGVSLVPLTLLVRGALGGADQAAADHSRTLQLNERVGRYILMTWTVTVHVSGPEGEGSAEVPLDVESSPRGAWPWLAGGLPVVGLAAVWWLRRRRAGRVRRAAGGACLFLVALAPASALAVHGSPPAPLGRVAAADLKAQVDRGQPPALIDLRPADRFREGHLPGARSIPLRELRRRYREIPRGRVVLYCDCSPDDLEAAYRLLVDRGVDDISALEEGFAGWRRRGYPIAR